MSSNSNNSAIKRFTYDWLIRFAELHPIEPYYSGNHPFGAYNPRYSKYAPISPMFTTCIERHMPDLFYVDLVIDSKIEELAPSLSKNRCYIIVAMTCTFSKLTSGMISKHHENRQFFYGDFLVVGNDIEIPSIPVAELTTLFKFHKFARRIKLCAVLAEPLMFSEVWQHLRHYEKIVLCLKDIDYEDIATVLRENRFMPEECCISWLDVSDHAVLEVFDFVLSMPVRPSSNLLLKFFQKKPASLSMAIVDKYKRAGRQISRHQHSATFNTVSVSVINGCCFFKFSDINYNHHFYDF